MIKINVNKSKNKKPEYIFFSFAFHIGMLYSYSLLSSEAYLTANKKFF